MEKTICNGFTSFRGIHFCDELKLDEEQRRAYGVETPAGLYPEYYLLKVNNFNDVAKDGLDQWMYFLKNESIEPEFDARGLMEAKETLDVLKLDDQERREYERWQLELHQRASMVQSHYGRGYRIGEEKGIEKGRAELILNMLKNGMSIVQVSQATGLAIDEIIQLGS